MPRSIRLIVASSALAGTTLLAALPSAAFVRSTDPTTEVCLFWADRHIPWVLNDRGAGGASVDQLEAALQRSFDAWEDVSCSDLKFTPGGRTQRQDRGFDPAASDNVNLMVFREGLCSDTVDEADGCHETRTCANLYNCWDHAPGVIALTTVKYNRKTGQAVDADIEFNARSVAHDTGYPFTATPEDAPACGVGAVGSASCVRIDVQNTATHEIGHLVGLEHSPVAEATMYATAPFGETLKRSLDQDDVDAVCSVYPSGALPTTCSPRGRLTFEEVPLDDASGCASTSPLGALTLLGLLGRRRRSPVRRGHP